MTGSPGWRTAPSNWIPHLQKDFQVTLLIPDLLTWDAALNIHTFRKVPAIKLLLHRCPTWKELYTFSVTDRGGFYVEEEHALILIPSGSACVERTICDVRARARARACVCVCKREWECIPSFVTLTIPVTVTVSPGTQLSQRSEVKWHSTVRGIRPASLCSPPISSCTLIHGKTRLNLIVIQT